MKHRAVGCIRAHKTRTAQAISTSSPAEKRVSAYNYTPTPTGTVCLLYGAKRVPYIDTHTFATQRKVLSKSLPLRMSPLKMEWHVTDSEHNRKNYCEYTQALAKSPNQQRPIGKLCPHSSPARRRKTNPTKPSCQKQPRCVIPVRTSMYRPAPSRLHNPPCISPKSQNATLSPSLYGQYSAMTAFPSWADGEGRWLFIFYSHIAD